MKILIAASKYLPAVGGLEKSVYNIALECKRRGHDVSIVTNRYKRHLPAKDHFDGIEVSRYFFTTIPPRSLNPWVWFKYGVRLFLVPYSFFSLLHKIKKEKPDIVHLHFVGGIAFYVLLARKFVHFPLVASLHGSDVEKYEEKNIFEKWVLKRILLSADFVTSNSKHLLEEALQKTGLKVLERSGVVPMAFSPDKYEEIPMYRHPKPYIFSAGRFVYKKGLDVLLQSFAAVLQMYPYAGDLIIAGDGEEFSKYKKIAKEQGIEDRVVFYGIADWSQMVSLLKGCDFFVIPSRMEAFGIVLLEALYTDKKVIASKVGGLVELMTDNPQFLAEPGRPEILAEKMKELLSGKLVWNPIDRTRLKETYSWGKVAHSYLRIYKGLISVYLTAQLVSDQFASDTSWLSSFM